MDRTDPLELPSVTVIVLNWNRAADTIACLESLKDQSYTNLSVLVVDNGSFEASVKEIAAAFPAVPMIRNSTNLGYSTGNNIGIKNALESGAECVMLLNNDTLVEPDAIAKLVKVLISERNIGAVGPKITYTEQPDLIWAAGGEIKFGIDLSQHRGYNKKDSGEFDDQVDVDYLPGCSILIRREALENVGLLDESFSPAYFEDSDWGLRAAEAGYKLVYVPEAVIRHKVSRSGGGPYNRFERYMLGYNGVQFLRKHGSAVQQVGYFLLNAAALPFIMILRFLQGNGWTAFYKFLGTWDALFGLPRRKLLG